MSMGSVVFMALFAVVVVGIVFATGYALGKRRGKDGYVTVSCIWVDQYGVTRGREEKMYDVPLPGAKLGLFGTEQTCKRKLTHGHYVVSHTTWQQNELTGAWMPEILASWEQ